MSSVQHLVPAEGLRALVAHLDHGTVRFSRVEGQDVVVECPEGVIVERSGDQLRIRGGGRRTMEAGVGGHKVIFARESKIDSTDPATEREAGSVGGHRITFDREPGIEEPRPFGVPDKGDLGAFISNVVNQAVGGLFRGDFFLGVAHGRVRVGVPALLETPRIEVHSAAGDLSLEGLTGEIVLHSHMGDITVSDAGGSLEARSGKGDVEIRDFRGPLRVHTGAGSMELERCTGGGWANTGAGDIEGRDLRGAWELRTGSGDVQVAVDEAASFQISTGSGDVEISGGSLDRLEVRTGSGDLECASVLRGARHQLTTGAGDIKLALADPPGARIQAITRMGSINSEFPLVMVGKQGPHSGAGSRYVGSIGASAIDVELRTSYGDIEIRRLDPARASRAARRETASPEPGASPRGFPPMPPIPPMPPMFETASPPPAPEFGQFGHEEQGMAREDAAPYGREDVAAPAPEAAEPAPAAASTATNNGENPRLKVLESLQRGEITAQEASALLRALSGA